MNRKRQIVSILILSLLLSWNQVISQTAVELLPKAIQLEEVQGELEQAIEVYKSIVEKYPDNRPIAAEAYVHMGRCYEKLGRQDAQKAYNMVINEYADQEEMVSEAKARLAVLYPSVPAEVRKEMTVRKVWDGPDADFMGAPSPDGKYISYVDWDSGNLAIYEVATAKKRILTNEGTWNDPIQFAEFSCWSPDGKSVVYDWYKDDNPSWIDLHIVGLDGSEPRKLWSNEEMEWAIVYDWSPDGKQILACLARKDKVNTIALISVTDGSVQTLKEFKGHGYLIWPQEMKFSPDGQYIAYDIRQDKNSSQRDIYLISSDGSGETCVVNHPLNDIFLGWMPDREEIFFASDRNGTMGGWSIQIQNGIPQGEPSLIRPAIGSIQSMGFTQDGSYFYGIIRMANNVEVIEIEPETGEIITHLDKAIQHFEGNNQTPSYSRDGKSMAFVRRSPWNPGVGSYQGGNILCVKSLETGREQEYRPALNRFGWPIWSPDGKSVLVVHWDADDQMSYEKIDVQTGLATTLVSTKENFSLFGGHFWSPDGKTIYYGLMERKARTRSIVSKDLESGTEKTIFQSKAGYDLSLSPDGKWLALCFSGYGGKAHVDIIPISGGESQELISFDKKTTLAWNSSLTWAVDGKYILFAIKDPDSQIHEDELYRVRVEDGKLKKLGVKANGGFENLNAHPNGRNFTYGSRSERSTKIWVMENFLPEK